MRRSDTLAAFAKALCAAQGILEVAKKDNTNTFFAKGTNKAKYADINNVWVACRAALTKNGIAVIQEPSITETRMVRLTTLLVHESGEWLEGELDLKPKEDSAQAIGSCITYARRYALSSMVGIVCEDSDDDGNAASIGPAAKKQDVIRIDPKLTEAHIELARKKVLMVEAAKLGIDKSALGPIWDRLKSTGRPMSDIEVVFDELEMEKML